MLPGLLRASGWHTTRGGAHGRARDTEHLHEGGLGTRLPIRLIVYCLVLRDRVQQLSSNINVSELGENLLLVRDVRQSAIDDGEPSEQATGYLLLDVWGHRWWSGQDDHRSTGQDQDIISKLVVDLL